MKKRALLFLFALVVLVFTGCGIPFQKKLDMYLQAEQYKEADMLISAEKKDNKENIYSGKNELLYFFDKGAVLQMLKDYEGSSAMLQKADDKIDALYTKSLVDETAALLSDENALEYRGEDFERVMVNILAALNYMYAGDFDGARVEVKRINSKLNLFMDEYGEKCIYTEDAFARYISAFAYEASGDINDAFIDYKKSLKAYEKYASVYGTAIPGFIKSDLLRAADGMKDKEAIAEFAESWGEKPAYMPYKELKSKGEIMIVVYNGLPAVKYDSDSWPKYRDRGVAFTNAVAEVDGKQYNLQSAQDVATMASKNLDNRVGLMLAKKVASSAVKGIFQALTGVDLGKDKADIRCWKTIPSRFDIIRIPVEPGKKKIKVTMYPVKGEPRVETLEVSVNAGKKKVVPMYVFAPAKMPLVVEKK